MKESKFYKWLDNFWYHYKWIFLSVLMFTIFIIVSTVQMFTKEQIDMYMMYAGPRVISGEAAVNIERAFEKLDDKDYTGDGKVNANLRDLFILSKEEQLERQSDTEPRDAVAEGQIASMVSQNYQTFNQEILGGDSVICLLSPFAYSTVDEAGGFLPIKEVLGYEPDGLYDDCGILLNMTDFGKYNEGLSTLPEDTILCIRRISSMGFLKGQKKTEEHHKYYLEKFKAALEWKKPE